VADDEITSPMEDLSEDYSSPRAMPNQKRHQSPAIRLDTDGGYEKEFFRFLSEAPRGNTRSAEGPCSSSSTEEDSKSKSKSMRRRSKKKRKGAVSTAIEPKFATTVVNIEELKTQAAGKPGRPPTTGEYVKLAEKKKAVNDEIERERRLELERRVFSMEETLDILRRARLDPEDKMEEASLALTADLANEMRKAQAEIIRVAKVNSNLKGPLQRALKVAASNID